MVISDGTGETATSVARAAMSQYQDEDIYFTRYKNVRTEEKLQSLFQEATLHFDLVLYTLAQKSLRSIAYNLSEQSRIRSIDILGPVLGHFEEVFPRAQEFKPGLLHHLNDSYFKKVEAIEFTIENDNTTNLDNLEAADIILIGISRTSKTPLAVYLSLKGLKTLSYQIKLDQKLPPEFNHIPQEKIYALTTDPKVLQEVRSGLKKKDTDFADSKQLDLEVSWAKKIYDQNPRWPVFDVSNKTLEEVGVEIIRLHTMRQENQYKKDQRDK